MRKKHAEVLMNPIRQRILQYLLIHKEGTTSDIKKELNDIPSASLYRHVKVLLEAGYIEVTEEKQIRGTTEKTYGLVENFFGEIDNEDISAIMQTGLLSLMTSFQRYFSKENVEPEKDMLSFTTTTLMLTDEEFAEIFNKIGNILNDAINKKPEKERKPRRLTIISSPNEE